MNGQGSHSVSEPTPHILLLLAQNALQVSRSLRERYIEHTLRLRDYFRQSIQRSSQLENIPISFLKACKIHLTKDQRSVSPWDVCFIDGGVGYGRILGEVPLIIRGGIFRIQEGEMDIQKRETFEFFPILVGDIEGGERDSGDFPMVIRIIAELVALWHVLRSTDYKNVSHIILHGPLLYRLSAYSAHWIYKKDLSYFVRFGRGVGDYLEEIWSIYDDFLCHDPKPRQWIDAWRKGEKIRAIYLIGALLKDIRQKAQEQRKTVLGIVEKATATEVIRQLFDAMLRDQEGKELLKPFIGEEVPSQIAAQVDTIIRRSRYNDPLLLSVLLNEGEYIYPIEAKERYSGFVGEVEGFGEYLQKSIPIKYTYLKVFPESIPFRIEHFVEIEGPQATGLYAKLYSYARLLPSYAFPLGLDIVDKFVRIPKWMVKAYERYILLSMKGSGHNTTEEEIRSLLRFYILNDRVFQKRPNP